MAAQMPRVPIDRTLYILKVMIDAAIARGETRISNDIAQFVKEQHTPCYVPGKAVKTHRVTRS
jgi:hypothetical protein